MLAVASDDHARAIAAIDGAFLDDLEPEARARAEHVIDLDAEQNSCPACGEAFRVLPRACPGCGLRLGG